MPVVPIRPAATGTYDEWSLSAGASKAAACNPGDPVSHDDAATYITSTGVNRQAFTLQATGSPAVGKINSLTLKTRDQDDPAGGTLGAYVRVAGADGVEQTTSSLSGTTTWTTRTIATNPLKSGSAALQPTDIKYSNTDFQIVLRTPGGAAVNVSSFWGDLDYLPPVGGFRSLIVGLIGASIGWAALRPEAMPALGRLLLERHGVRLKPEEYAIAYRELRDGRFARHFLMEAA